jgi:hypothetical protein
VNALGGGASNSHPSIKPLNLTAQEQKDLVACQQAPFDHPALRLTNGHTGDHRKVTQNAKTGLAQDDYLDLPAVGPAGLAANACLRNDDASAVK